MFSKFFINRPNLSAVLSIVIIIAGLICIFKLPIEQYPRLVPTQINIQANYTGASAKTLSTSVASIIENAINGAPGLLYIQSSASSAGRLDVNAFFSNDIDSDIALVNVNNRVQSVISQLPAEVQRSGVNITKSSTAVAGFYHLYSSNPAHNQLFLANYALLNIIDDLKRIDGVGEVGLWSLQNYAMRIWLDPNKLYTHNLTPLEVRDSIQSQNAQFAPGKLGAEPLGESDFTYMLIGDGLFTSTEEFENIIIRANSDGSALRLKDIARIELGAQDYSTENYYNTTKSAPLRITMKAGANMLDVVEEIDSTLARLSHNFPQGMSYSNPYRPTDFITASLKEVLKTFLEAIVLVVVVIYLFLGNFRATLIPIMAIPVFTQIYKL